jgi:hypothetical protein
LRGTEIELDVIKGTATTKVGVIYPILPEHFERLLSNRTVFCKFGRMFVSSGPDTVVVFYQSGRKLVGEGRVESISRLSPVEAIGKYRDRLFLNRDELLKYSTSSRWRRPPDTAMLVFELKDLVRYPLPFMIHGMVPPAGRSLTREVYDAIHSQQ